MEKTSDTIKKYWESRGEGIVHYKGESFYTVTSLPYYLKRRNVLLSKIKAYIYDNNSERGSILDFGCGDGYYTTWAKQHFPEAQVCGCDLSSNMIASSISRADQMNLDIKYRVSDSNIPFKEKFDIIIIVAVFAHIMDEDLLMNSIIKDLKNHIKENGVLLLFESTGIEPRKGKTWHRRSKEFYESLFSINGFTLDSTYSIQYPFFQYCDKMSRKFYSLLRGLFRKIGRIDDESQIKGVENLNNNNLYIYIYM